MVKNLHANAGDIRDVGLIPESGRSPGGGHGNPLQYSCLEDHMIRGSLWAIVHTVAQSWTQFDPHIHMIITAQRLKREIWKYIAKSFCT